MKLSSQQIDLLLDQLLVKERETEKVGVNEWFSQVRDLRAWGPQGSGLGQVLFNLVQSRDGELVAL